jgi:hypothetical protein
MVKETVSEVPDDVDYLPRVADEGTRRRRRNRWRIVGVLLLASLMWLLVWSRSALRTMSRLLSGPAPFAPADHVPDIGFSEGVLRTWAQYAPYIPAAEYIPPPLGCDISQVSVHPYIPRRPIDALCLRCMWYVRFLRH